MFKTRWRSSLRIKLTLWAFAPTLVIFCVALLTFTAYQRATEDLAIERNLDLVRLLAEQLTIELDGSVQSLEEIVQHAHIKDTLPENPEDALSRARSGGGGFDAGAMLFDSNGTLIAIDPPQSNRLGEDWSDYSWFSTNSSAFSGVVALGVNASDVAILTVPIRNDQHQVIGVLGGMFYVPPRSNASSVYAGINRSVLAHENIPEDIIYVSSQGRIRPISELSAPARLFQHTRSLRLGLSETSEIYVVDSSGRAVYHTDSKKIGHDLSQSNIVQQSLVSSFGAIRTRNLADEEVVASYAAVGNTGWHVLVEESWDSINAFSYSYRLFLQITLVIGLLLPALIVSNAVKRVTQVIGRMVQAARQVAGGNFGRVIETQTGDELDDLAKQFNTMSMQLKASYADLEQRVDDRTRELATLNKIARVTGESLSLSDILQSALQETLGTLDFCAGQAQVTDPATHASIITVDCGKPLLSCQEIADQIADDPRCKEALNNCQPYLLPCDADQDELHCIVIVPLLSEDRLLGQIILCSNQKTTLSQEEIDLLAAIGRQVGLAADKALLHDKAQELAVVKERNRLARDLHDSVTQSLYAITFYSQAAERLINNDQSTKAAEHIRQVSETSQAALREMRLLLLDLRPPDIEKEGLVSALQKRLDAVEGRSGLITRLQVQGNEPDSAETVDALYRIASEALNNALKHSGASELSIVLDFRNSIKMQIMDNGSGFYVAETRDRGGMGLSSMKERASSIGASLSITTAPGKGTIVMVEAV